MKTSFRSIHPALAGASPRHKAICNPRKEWSGRKNSARDPVCPKPAPDTRICCIQTNTFGPWLIDLIILAGSASLTSSSRSGHWPTWRRTSLAFRCDFDAVSLAMELPMTSTQPATKVPFLDCSLPCSVCTSINTQYQTNAKLIRARAR